MKTCPKCNTPLPLSEFGVCNARPDGRNLYCKGCACKMVAVGRLRKQAWANRKPKPVAVQLLPDRPRSERPTVVDRVFSAIRDGARTQGEMRAHTKLDEDQIANALMKLILEHGLVGTRTEDDHRYYFISEAA